LVQIIRQIAKDSMLDFAAAQHEQTRRVPRRRRTLRDKPFGEFEGVSGGQPGVANRRRSMSRKFASRF
jgi:hypothetical protein